MQQMKTQNGVLPSLFDNVTEQEQNKRDTNGNIVPEIKS